VKKVALNVAQAHFLPKTMHKIVPLKNVVHIFWLLLYIIEKLPKVNNHPIGENPPYLVTLMLTDWQDVLNTRKHSHKYLNIFCRLGDIKNSVTAKSTTFTYKVDKGFESTSRFVA
jgi:hypothetical protein